MVTACTATILPSSAAAASRAADDARRNDDCRDDEGDGKLHEVAPHDEVLETLEHGSLLRLPPWTTVRVSGLSPSRQLGALARPSGVVITGVSAFSRVLVALVGVNSIRAIVPNEMAVLELERCSGTQFDPVVVEAVWTAALLRDRPELRFEQLLDVCGVDYSLYGGATSSFGSSTLINYTINIANAGNMTLTSPVVSDPSVSNLAPVLSGGVSCAFSAIASIATWSALVALTESRPPGMLPVIHTCG